MSLLNIFIVGGIILLLFLFLFITFAWFVGSSLTVGMREHIGAFYDPKAKEWVHPLELSDEQKTRVIKGSRILAEKPLREVEDISKEEEIAEKFWGVD